MKREILFRGKRVDTKEWIEGSLLLPTTDRITTIIVAWNGTRFEVIPETVCQFTGLTESKNHPMFDDKIKLWEDDIFTVGKSNTKYQVIFDNYEWIGISDEGDDWGLYKYRLSAIKEPIHILGSIHDNL